MRSGRQSRRGGRKRHERVSNTRLDLVESGNRRLVHCHNRRRVDEGKMKPKNILKFARENIGRAVVIEWEDDQADSWHHFRVEDVQNDEIALSGMADDDRNQHDGSFFWETPHAIKTIKRRRK